MIHPTLFWLIALRMVTLLLKKCAVYFESNSKPFNASRNEGLKAHYRPTGMRSNYYGSPIAILYSAVWSRAFRQFSLFYGEWKSCRLVDGVSCEHLKFSHHSLISILFVLYYLFTVCFRATKFGELKMNIYWRRNLLKWNQTKWSGAN